MRPILLTLLLAGGAMPAAGQSAPRPISLDDVHTLREVSDPRLSPEGAWVAYTVSSTNLEMDEEVSDLWMTSWDGRSTLQLTRTPKESEHTPRWSPDGRYLAFLSGRGGPDGADQLWLLSRQGGEAERVTEVKSGIRDYAWSPDGRRFALVIGDSDSLDVSGDTTSKKVPPPLVIDRFYFKEDYTGYVLRKRSHLYLFDLDSRNLEQLTHGQADDLLPSWSPDGQYLAFSSKRVGDDPDRHDNWDLWVIQAAKGAVPRQLTTFTGPDAHPDWGSPAAWSPDAHTIAYLQGGPDSLIYYSGPRLATMPWGGGSSPTILTGALDRHVMNPIWSPDGHTITFRLEDDRSIHLAQVPAAGGPVERLMSGHLVVAAHTASRDGRRAMLISTPEHPAEVFAQEDGTARQLSHQNDALLAQVRVAPVEEFSVKSRDGTNVNGFLVRPTGYLAGTRYPTVLWIHGGPVGQHQNEFEYWWQLLAAEGYAVVAMNPRGSSGRGEKFSLAIWADWGNKDAQDVLAGLDYAVKAGVADPDRLGVGGWSYGGILTNQVIAQDMRFKAAVSGAGAANFLAGYGTDMYVREYEAELGVPWKNTATWLKLSAPFLHADRIRTPTLFMCGEKDFNVPLLNSEQMYQALRSLGVPTKLVIYPDQYHGIGRPSYKRHRYAQWLAWYDEYLRKM